MIGGIIVSGGETAISGLIVRAIGPSLIPLGVTNALLDPILEIHDENGALLSTNDNWRDSQEAAIFNTGLAPSHDLESTMLLAGFARQLHSGRARKRQQHWRRVGGNLSPIDRSYKTHKTYRPIRLMSWARSTPATSPQSLYDPVPATAATPASHRDARGPHRRRTPALRWRVQTKHRPVPGSKPT